MGRSKLLVAGVCVALAAGVAVPELSAASTARIRALQQASASTGNASASSIAASFPLASSNHALLVVVVTSDGPTEPADSVTDDAGNEWHVAVQNGFGLDGALESQVWYAFNALPATTVTVDYGTFTGHLMMDLVEYAGADRVTDPLDGWSPGSQGISGESCTTSLVPTQPGDLAVGISVTSPRRRISVVTAGFKASKQLSAGANSARSGRAVLPTADLLTFETSWTGNAAYACVVVVFRARS